MPGHALPRHGITWSRVAQVQHRLGSPCLGDFAWAHAVQATLCQGGFIPYISNISSALTQSQMIRDSNLEDLPHMLNGTTVNRSQQW
ncbi:hypothetical protein Q3G72_026364 [Acer saccharum]|nr:hypothetical protein Q3G72_026364 [Acer saccharum]